MMPEFGWPSWPPRDVPTVTNWTENEIRQLPLVPKRGFSNATFIEIDGVPQSGKSTLFDSINKPLEEQLQQHGWKLVVYDDPVHTTPDTVYTLCPDPVFGFGDFDVLLFEKDEDSWFTSITIDMGKNIYWQYVANQYLRGFNPKTLVLGYRGPVDSNLWSYTVAAHKVDPKFVMPEDIKNSI